MGLITGSDKLDTKPFLRWAGGKSWLARQSNDVFSQINFDRYHEPFLGGGSFYFSLTNASSAYLSDSNVALIEAYECIQQDHQKVIAAMQGFQNTEEDYYRIRALSPQCRFERAAQFVYLNQTSFNGIYRVNLRGQYNVPYGHRSKSFLDEKALEAASKALQVARLRACDFVETLDEVKAGDLVFLDPPYTVSHNHNGFIKYNQSLFSLEDQHRLAEYIVALREIGANYILTNAAHPKVKEIFEMGDTCLELSRANLIGGKKAKRGSVTEFLFTNLQVR